MNTPPTPPKTNPEPKQRIEQRQNGDKARMERMRARNERLRQRLASLPDIKDDGAGKSSAIMDIFKKHPPPPPPPAMKTGGLIKSTGVYKLHKGEVVVPANRVKSVDMSLKKDKKKPLKK